MTTTGFLLHVYHLGSEDWDQLVWGNPERDLLGAGAKLFECLLAEPVEDTVSVILYDGPSTKDGVTEGQYTRRFLQTKLSEIEQFPKLRGKLSHVSSKERIAFKNRVRNMIVAGDIENTFDEICLAAQQFKALGATRIIHVASASHAPRCIQLQAKAREMGLVPDEQLWYTVASDQAFAGTSASDVVVVEPPHRADDPMLRFRPMLASLLKQYFTLRVADKKRFIQRVEKLLYQTADSSTGLRKVNFK